ncbi:MAG: ACT domain-containing protein [Thermodesulfovibrionales bacterium]|nr:ACT domain-containing protein [Thermodesulfovibrionales bacterium]
MRQLSIFAENKPGKLEKITRVMAEASINILAISISSSGDFGVIKFIVDKPEEAKEKLIASGFTVSLNEVLAIELVDKPGDLHRVAVTLSKNGVNIENANVLVVGARETSYLIVELEDVAEAKKKLLGQGLKFYDM